MIKRSLGPTLHGADLQPLSIRRDAHRIDPFELTKDAPPPSDRSGPPLPPPNYTRDKWLAAAGIVAGATAGSKLGQFLMESPFFSLPTASLALGAVGGLFGACLGLYFTRRSGNEGGAPDSKAVLAGGTLGLALGATSGILLGGAMAVYGSVASLGVIGAVVGLMGAAIVNRKLTTGNG